MIKEISDSLHFLLHCSLKDVRFETQREQFEFIYKYIENLEKENQELQEQLSIKTLQLEEIKLSKRDYTQENILEMKLTLKKNQQKEFIEYLENMLDNENDIFSVVRVKDVLSKYKEIIGGK